MHFPINRFLLREGMAGHEPYEEQVDWYRVIFAALGGGGQVLVVSKNGAHRSFGGGPPVTLFSRRPPDDCCGSAGGGGGARFQSMPLTPPPGYDPRRRPGLCLNPAPRV